MSLIKCEECGNKISDRSLFCPHCGFPTHLNAAHPTGKAPEEFEQIEKAVKAAVKSAGVSAEPVETPKQKPADPKPEEPRPAAEEKTETPRPAETPEVEAVVEAEEEEIDLEERHRRNERAKIWMFIGVFLVLLGVVIYIFMTAPADTAAEDDAEMIESAETAVVDSAATDSLDAADSTAPVAAQTVTPAVAPAVAPAAAPAAPAAKPAPRAVREPAPAAEEPREVTVKSLREQTSEPSPAQPAVEPSAE